MPLHLFALLFLVIACANPRPKLTIIAHRGASAHLPEHSLAGVAMAHADEADFIEADLVMTRDNHLIVLHDLTLEATTNVAELFPKRARADGHFYAIDFDLKEIQQLELKERVNPLDQRRVYPLRFSYSDSGLRVPSFQQFLQVIHSLNKTRGQAVGIYPEIKAPSFHQQQGKDITAAVLKALREWGYEQHPELVYIQCFEPEPLIRLKTEFQTTLPLIQLMGENSWKLNSVDYNAMRSPEGIKKMATYAVGVGPWLGSLDPELVAEFKRQKLLIHPYTHRDDQRPVDLDTEGFMAKIKKLGVDGIFTDHAELWRR